MKRLPLLACLLLFGCVSDRVHSNYKGTDAGDLVFSVGWRQPAGFLVFYRKVGQPSGLRGFGGDGMLAVDDGILGRPMDFEGDEAGQVHVQHLESGNYEIYTFQIITAAGPFATVTFSPRSDFSIPFTIEPGKAVYIGDFMLVPDIGADLFGARVVRGGHVVVSDKHGRDIPIALKQDPQLRPVTISVFDVSSLGVPSLVSGKSH